MFDDKENKRFITVYKQGIVSTIKIIVDTQTGVNYLVTNDGSAGGLTVLLDKDGKPVISRSVPHNL